MQTRYTAADRQSLIRNGPKSCLLVIAAHGDTVPATERNVAHDLLNFMMNLNHKIILYSALGFLGFCLIIPGLIEIFKNPPGGSGLVTETIDAKNQLRALNGMMTGIGFIALYACAYLENSRVLVLALGWLLLMVAAARIYSLFIDGCCSLTSWLYLAVEFSLALLFLLWPPK